MAIEAQLHRAVKRFLDVALPADAIWTTFPAGGGGKVRGAQLKAAGLRAGWPDIQVLWREPGLGNRGVFIGIELKAGSPVSTEQLLCHADIREAGGYVFVCRSVDEVEGFLRGVGIPLKAATFGRGTIATPAPALANGRA